LPRSEYGEIVVFAPVFWLQSRKTFPGRSDLVIFHSTRSGCSAGQLLGDLLRRVAHTVGVQLAGQAAYMCRPLLPEVTGAADSPRSASLSRTSSATWQHSCSPAGRARVEVDHQPVRVERRPFLPTVHWCTCSSSEARLAK
jgi:hypothetical protein